MRRAVWLAGACVALAALACHSPVKVRKIDQPDTEPAKGVRMRLGKPSFTGTLQSLPIQNGECRYKVVLQHGLSGFETYEATTVWNPFATTNVAIDLDDDGLLTGATASATDQLLPTIQAVIGLAAATARAAALAAPTAAARTPDCGQGDPALARHVARRDQLAGWIGALEGELSTLQTGGSHATADLERARLLRTELASVRARYEAEKIALGPGNLTVRIDGARYSGPAHNALVTVDLR